MSRWRSQVNRAASIVTAIVPAATNEIAAAGPVTVSPPESPTKTPTLTDLVVYCLPRPGQPVGTYITVSKDQICQQSKRYVTILVNKSGISSPLMLIESQIVAVIIQMSRIFQSLTPT